ncbi:hypothetical protein ACLB2K_024778 [Fragaria x ananassa]
MYIYLFSSVRRRRRRASTRADTRSVPDHFPFPKSPPNSSFPARSIFIEVLGGGCCPDLQINLVEKGKWSGTPLVSARVEVRHRRRRTEENRRRRRMEENGGTSAL